MGLAYDVALEHSDDLGLGATLLQSALHVGLSTGLRAQAGDHRAPQRTVGLAIPTAVESNADHLAK